MSIAVIGTGKTGSAVLALLGRENAVGFDRKHPVSVDKLAGMEAAIIFVPGTAVAELLPIVLAAKIPAVWGSTGYEWPAALAEKLAQQGSTWVLGANFSLGMQLMRQVLQLVGAELDKLLPAAEVSLHEVHHLHKKDAPSGTALAWQEWLEHPCEITYERIGDVKGEHQLSIKTPEEELKFSHEAFDRAVFARGAIWAAHYVLAHQKLPAGLYRFAELINHSRNKDGRTSP